MALETAKGLLSYTMFGDYLIDYITPHENNTHFVYNMYPIHLTPGVTITKKSFLLYSRLIYKCLAAVAVL